MKGATALDPPKTIKIPNNNKISITGRSQNFFLCLKKLHKSFKNSITI